LKYLEWKEWKDGGDTEWHVGCGDWDWAESINVLHQQQSQPLTD